ncbi:chorismate mutase, partial [Francisella tularensis]|uniref:chorismate mutase n=1 Tax=Francisella tularensis TaxID=263 RepID=UPI002381C100
MNKLVKVVAGVFSLRFGFCYAGGVDKPLSLLVERASLMQEVGVCNHKFNSPIYDTAQEIRVL